MTTAQQLYPITTLDGCRVWPLPVDDTIATVARTQVRQEIQRLPLRDSLVEECIPDATLMVSELATNVLKHAMPVPVGYPPATAELWAYLRHRSPHGTELVIKVFDTRRDRLPRPSKATDLDEHGRGLAIVEALAPDRWGCHLTRSRLRDTSLPGNPPRPGKAVWFALPLPNFRPAASPFHPLDEATATRHLRDALAQRGIDRTYYNTTTNPAVLSIRPDLNVWCRKHAFSWRSPDGDQHLAVSDLAEICEQLVRLYEDNRQRGGKNRNRP